MGIDDGDNVFRPKFPVARDAVEVEQLNMQALKNSAWVKKLEQDTGAPLEEILTAANKALEESLANGWTDEHVVASRENNNATLEVADLAQGLVTMGSYLYKTPYARALGLAFFDKYKMEIARWQATEHPEKRSQEKLSELEERLMKMEIFLNGGGDMSISREEKDKERSVYERLKGWGTQPPRTDELIRVEFWTSTENNWEKNLPYFRALLRVVRERGNRMEKEYTSTT